MKFLNLLLKVKQIYGSIRTVNKEKMLKCYFSSKYSKALLYSSRVRNVMHSARNIEKKVCLGIYIYKKMG